MLQTKANKDLEQSTKDVTAKLLSMLEIGARDRQITAWRDQPNAPELQAEMLALLKEHLVKLGVSVPTSCKQLCIGADGRRQLQSAVITNSFSDLCSAAAVLRVDFGDERPSMLNTLTVSVED